MPIVNLPIPRDRVKPARVVIGSALSRWSSVDCDYLCDGIDDQEEINLAIQRMSPNGGKIVLLDGTYYLSSAIILGNNIMLSGNGSATILKRVYNNTEKGGIVTINATANGCTICDLTIDGNRAVYSSAHNRGIYLNGSNDVTIYNTRCIANEVGIDVSGNNHRITGSIVKNNVTGINLAGNESTIVGNIITANTGNGVGSTFIQNMLICDNICNDNAIIGLGINGNYNVISGNTCNNSSIGISLQGQFCTITGNVCYDNGTGIHLTQSGICVVSANVVIRGSGETKD